MMAGDISQIAVITKNELIKCVRGRKFMISLLIVLIIFLLITALQFVIDNWDHINSLGEFTSIYFDSFVMVVTLVVALLSSIAIVSEFEERTALILFTRPVRRTSILIGKILSCLIIESLIILLYFIMAWSLCYYKIGELPADLLTSFGMAVLYAFAASGVAFVISAFFKKGSVCTIISVLLIVLIIPIISTMVASNDGENWYMLDQAGRVIYTCIPEYVDYYNQTIIVFDDVVGQAVAILEGFTDADVQQAIQAFLEYYATLDPEQQAVFAPLVEYLNTTYSGNLQGMIYVLKMLGSSSILAPMEYPDVTRAALVLLAWGIVGYFIAWIRFIKREF